MKDMSLLNNNFPWLVFNLNKSFFALSCENITSIAILPKGITKPVLTPPYIRGLLDMRGEFIPLLDMRNLFGFPTLGSEFDNFKEAKAAAVGAHQAWVDELTRSVEKGGIFTGELDPTKCTFGKWLATFNSCNNVINSHLRKINVPHRELHQAGTKIVELQKQSQSAERSKNIMECLEKVTQISAPAVFSTLVKIEEDWLEAHREMVIIFTYGDKKIGLIVDEVQSVEKLEILNQEVSRDMQGIAHFFTSIARSTKSDKIIILINETQLGILFSESDFNFDQDALTELAEVEA